MWAMARLRGWLAVTGAGYAAVLRSDNLRRSQLAWAGAITAEWGFFVGLGVFAFEESGTLGVGLVGLIRMLPSAVVAPLASVLGDRYRRDRVALGLFIAMAVAVAIAALLAFDEPSVVVIYALAAVHGAASTLSRSAQWALLPSLARTPDELVAANGATLTTENLGTLAGPALGALVLAVSGPGSVFAVCAVVYLLAAIVLARIRLEEAPQPRVKRRGVARELLAGFPALVGDVSRALVVGLFFAQAFVRGALNVFLVVVALELLHTGESGVGFLTGALGLGGLVGAAVSLSISGRRLAFPFASGLVLWGLPIVGIGAWPETAVALMLLAILGAGNSVLDVSGLTLLQRLVPNDVLTRALGVFWGFAMATMGVGSIATTGLIALVGIRWALAAVGTLLPVLTLLAWRRLSSIDRSVGAPQERLDALDRVPMFAPLSLVAKERLASALVAVARAAGSEIMRQGDAGDRFYIVADGTLDVTRDGRRLSTRAAGDYFGEIALLRDVPRTATVTAADDVRLFALERDDFLDAVTGHAAGLSAGEAVVADRLATVS
jgi:MFS family permease